MEEEYDFSSVEYLNECSDEVFEISEVSEFDLNQGSKKKRKRNEYFSPEEKKTLAAEVEKRVLLWDLSHPQHYNTNATNLAWRQIGAVLNRGPSDCKKAWIALRESHRYHTKVKNMKKSGSEGGVPCNGDTGTGELEWEYASDLAFLPDRSKKRKTYCTASNLETEDERTDGEKPSTSNYDYQTRPKRSNRDREDDTVANLADNINNLIEHQRSLQHVPEERTQAPLVNYVQLANIDRMLQQLPDSSVEDACFEITVLLYNKIKAMRLN